MWLQRFLSSTLGAKAVMAATGLFMVGFVIIHMVGNLQVMMGDKVFNHYAETLQTTPELLWTTRILLFSSVVLHILSWIRIQALTNAARGPVGYTKWQGKAGSAMSRAMKFTGPIVLVFIIVHLLHMTVGTLHSDFKWLPDAPDAYHNLTTGLSNPLWAGFYILAMAALAPHLQHGVFTMCKTLGVSGERQLHVARAIATAITVAVVGGNVLITLTILTGLVR